MDRIILCFRFVMWERCKLLETSRDLNLFRHVASFRMVTPASRGISHPETMGYLNVILNQTSHRNHRGRNKKWDEKAQGIWVCIVRVLAGLVIHCTVTTTVDYCMITQSNERESGLTTVVFKVTQHTAQWSNGSKYSIGGAGGGGREGELLSLWM